MESLKFFTDFYQLPRFLTRPAFKLANMPWIFAEKSKSGKIGFIAPKADPISMKYAAVFAKGAMAGNSKIKVFSKLADSNIEAEIAGLVDSGVDQLFSTWSKSDEVISTVARFNSAATQIRNHHCLCNS